MIKVEREFLKELRDYIINSLNDAIYHNSPHRIPPIQADLDKIDELLNIPQSNSCNCDQNIIDISKNKTHVLSEVICAKCCNRWIAVRAKTTQLKHLECKKCGQGFVIETGEVLENE